MKKSILVRSLILLSLIAAPAKAWDLKSVAGILGGSAELLKFVVEHVGGSVTGAMVQMRQIYKADRDNGFSSFLFFDGQGRAPWHPNGSLMSHVGHWAGEYATITQVGITKIKSGQMEYYRPVFKLEYSDPKLTALYLSPKDPSASEPAPNENQCVWLRGSAEVDFQWVQSSRIVSGEDAMGNSIVVARLAPGEENTWYPVQAGYSQDLPAYIGRTNKGDVVPAIWQYDHKRAQGDKVTHKRVLVAAEYYGPGHDHNGNLLTPETSNKPNSFVPIDVSTRNNNDYDVLCYSVRADAKSRAMDLLVELAKGGN